MVWSADGTNKKCNNLKNKQYRNLRKKESHIPQSKNLSQYIECFQTLLKQSLLESRLNVKYVCHLSHTNTITRKYNRKQIQSQENTILSKYNPTITQGNAIVWKTFCTATLCLTCMKLLNLGAQDFYRSVNGSQSSVNAQCRVLPILSDCIV